MNKFANGLPYRPDTSHIKETSCTNRKTNQINNNGVNMVIWYTIERLPTNSTMKAKISMNHPLQHSRLRNIIF